MQANGVLVRRYLGLGVVCLITLVALGSAQAQIYRWVDERGMTHYSTTPPPETALRDRQVLDRDGREREALTGGGTAEERERQAQVEAQAQREAELRQQEEARRLAEIAERNARARQLRLTYQDIEDIVAQRDRQRRLIEGTLELSQGQERILLRERERIQQQVETAEERGNQRELERYRAEIADLDGRLDRERNHQQRQLNSLEEIEARAQQDLLDYQRLVLDAEGR